METAMNDGRALWGKLLRIEEPWSVLSFKVDPSGRRHDVWVGIEVPRSWFGLARKLPQPAPTQSWRHVNFGDWEVRVHVVAPEGTDLSRHGWAGDPTLPFTRALSQQILGLLREGCSLQSICTLLGVPLTDLWRFRYAIDSGRWSTGEAPSEMPPAEAAAPAAASATPVAGADGELPAATDPVWRALLDGSLQIDIRVLGLKLMLTRLRSQLDLIGDEDIRMLKLQEFHRYFAKNRHLLAHELAQIRAA
jgi:hypothetical protein